MAISGHFAAAACLQMVPFCGDRRHKGAVTAVFALPPFVPPPGAAGVRAAVRAFLAVNPPPADAVRRANCWAVADADFSRALGAAGWLGMVWPRRYGGHERPAMERYIVLEELLAAGASVGAHWIADRQTGPLLLRYGSEAQRQRWLPGMAAGEVFACIGLSEPGAGSDLAAVRSRAEKVPGGWRINGQKLWTSGAHHAHVMLALLRSEPGSERQAGLSQFLIPMDTPGISVRPVLDLVGNHDFNEVFFDNVMVGDDALVGVAGQGWRQVTAELALERSGPERYLSSQALLVTLIEAARAANTDNPALNAVIGKLVAELWTLRQMSMATAAVMACGGNPAGLADGSDSVVEAAIVKDLGNDYEQRVPLMVQAVLDIDLDGSSDLARVLAHLLQVSPSFSLRGGTREVLRGIIARGLDLR
ncbi:MAG: acyl-CoA dehydrogenase family protein [Polymorphobacter sp.]